MSSQFSVIFEEFSEELEAIQVLVSASGDPKLGRPRARIAGANASILLLAATFEEFVREMARAYARSVIAAATSYEKIPSKLANVAWRRTMENLARIAINPNEDAAVRESAFSEAHTKFSVVYQFCRGDITQDIYQDLIHNENNMRPGEINSLFKISNLNNVCLLVSDNDPLKELFDEKEAGKVHGLLLKSLETFFERRNQVAHSISAMRSASPNLINGDIELLSCFGAALAATLEAHVPVLQTESGPIEPTGEGNSALREGSA